jgi:hypothetical protein
MGHVITKGGRIVTSGGRIATAPTIADNVLRDGSTVAWYDSSDLTTITKDGSDYVSRWNDKLGSGHDLIQATAAMQPKWYSGDGVLFDGSDDHMISQFPLNQPETIYIVFKQITWQTLNRAIFDGGGNGVPAALIQNVSSPNLNLMSAGGNYALGLNANLAINTFGICRAFFNQENSKFIVNNTTPQIGSLIGTGFTIGGITLGARGVLTNNSNIQVKEVILRNVADNAYDETAIYNYLANKYSFAPIYIDPVKVGDLYGGGIVAYILQSGDPGYEAGKTKGLIAAVSDQSAGIRWYAGSAVATGAYSFDIGGGLANTDAIIAAQGGILSTYAAGLARSYNGGGYTDWYLPSWTEANKIIWINRLLVGNFIAGTYWTSTQHPSEVTQAGVQYSDSGEETFSSTGASWRVRAVRSFTI